MLSLKNSFGITLCFGFATRAPEGKANDSED
jgi:hypothetical protein